MKNLVSFRINSDRAALKACLNFVLKLHLVLLHLRDLPKVVGPEVVLFWFLKELSES